MIRVLVVDDSETARLLLRRMVETAGDIKVVGQACDGREAVDLARTLKPDLITMDVRMPGTDGLKATEEIMAVAPTRIVMVTNEASDAEVCFQAMRAGALDVMTKPKAASTTDGQELASAKLVVALRAMSEVPVVRRRSASVSSSAGEAPRRRFSLLAIGASTGGPQVIASLLGRLPREFPCPIVVTQHIAPGFTPGFVRWMSHESKLAVAQAKDGDGLAPGTVYIAPDDRHLRVNSRWRISLGDDPPLGQFRPSVDAMFQSVADAIGSAAIGLLLTGMGNDGAKGLLALRRAGGWTLAQDAATATVNGMPEAARSAGAVDLTVTPDELPALLAKVTAPS